MFIFSTFNIVIFSCFKRECNAIGSQTINMTKRMNFQLSQLDSPIYTVVMTTTRKTLSERGSHYVIPVNQHRTYLHSSNPWYKHFRFVHLCACSIFTTVRSRAYFIKKPFSLWQKRLFKNGTSVPVLDVSKIAKWKGRCCVRKFKTSCYDWYHTSVWLVVQWSLSEKKMFCLPICRAYALCNVF